MTIQDFIKNNRDRCLEELFALLRIPSVSADSTFSQSVEECAQLVADGLRSAGLAKVEIHPTEGHPIVYAEHILDESLPTVLVYGHYDVQPADPIELWHRDPFDPVIQEMSHHKEGAIVARGAADDKGQFFMHVKALEYLIGEGELGVNVKVIIEGEEEVGSPNLETYLKTRQNELSCDLVLISDTGMLSLENPSITTGLRGLAYMEVEVTGPNRDLHSGVYGGGVQNPLNALCEMIASLKDSDGHITIPGFYDDLLEVSNEERQKMGKAPFDLEEYKAHLDIPSVFGEKGYSTLERTSIRPTLDVNGMWGGYTGEGAKTVLPSKAFAKVSMRLVPGQDSDHISQLFSDHFTAIAPPGVTVKVTPHHGGTPYVTPIDGPGYKAAERAMKTTFGKDPIPLRGGGSIPIVALFEQVLHSKTILLGFGLDTDAIHSPNEHFGVHNFFKGIETIPYFMKFYKEELDKA